MPEEERAGTRTQQLEINKAVVIDALKASCLIRSWVRSTNSNSPRDEITDAELGADLECWELVETLGRLEPGRYDEFNGPDAMLEIMDALSVSLFLSSEKEEYFEIRRELNKIKLWLKDAFKIDTEQQLPPSAAGTRRSESSYQELQTIARYLPELKQGWGEARAEGVQDYLTVLSLGMGEKRRE